MADTPLRYYRMSEASGTTAYDVSGSGANGTYNASPTLGSAGAISGDSADKSVTFNGSSQYVGGISVTGMPTGNGVASIEAWVFVTGSPASNAIIAGYGKSAAHQRLGIYMDTSRKLYADTQSGATGGSAAVSINAWHHVVGTWDGTTLICYVDGAVGGTTATPGAMTTPGSATAMTIAVDVTAAGSWFPGRIDEVAYYGACLSSTRITAHYNAGNAGTGMGTMTNALTLASGARISLAVQPGLRSTPGRHASGSRRA